MAACSEFSVYLAFKWFIFSYFVNALLLIIPNYVHHLYLTSTLSHWISSLRSYFSCFSFLASCVLCKYNRSPSFCTHLLIYLFIYLSVEMFWRTRVLFIRYYLRILCAFAAGVLYTFHASMLFFPPLCRWDNFPHVNIDSELAELQYLREQYCGNDSQISISSASVQWLM